jgi:hypothetical protein
MIDVWIEEASNQRIELEDKAEAISDRIAALEAANIDSEEGFFEEK